MKECLKNKMLISIIIVIFLFLSGIGVYYTSPYSILPNNEKGNDEFTQTRSEIQDTSTFSNIKIMRVRNSIGFPFISTAFLPIFSYLNRFSFTYGKRYIDLENMVIIKYIHSKDGKKQDFYQL